MIDQQHLSCDIVCLGAGMASTSLVLALISGGYRGRIIMVEKAASSPCDRTWCFWGRQQLPAYLQSLVKAQRGFKRAQDELQEGPT